MVEIQLVLLLQTVVILDSYFMVGNTTIICSIDINKLLDIKTIISKHLVIILDRTCPYQ